MKTNITFLPTEVIRTRANIKLVWNLGTTVYVLERTKVSTFLSGNVCLSGKSEKEIDFQKILRTRDYDLDLNNEGRTR